MKINPTFDRNSQRFGNYSRQKPGETSNSNQTLASQWSPKVVEQNKQHYTIPSNGIPPWRSSTKFLPTMEIDDKISMAVICNKPGVPDPMESQPETMENKNN
ncbi:unnamed protein product [Rhizopus stolonifer]